MSPGQFSKLGSLLVWRFSLPLCPLGFLDQAVPSRSSWSSHWLCLSHSSTGLKDHCSLEVIDEVAMCRPCLPGWNRNDYLSVINFRDEKLQNIAPLCSGVVITKIISPVTSSVLGTIGVAFCWCLRSVCHRWTILGMSMYFNILSQRDSQHYWLWAINLF